MAQSDGRGRWGCWEKSEPWNRQAASWVLIFLPSCPASLARWQGSPPAGSPFFCWVSSTQKKGIQGSSLGLSTSWGPSPQSRARTCRNCSLFSFPFVSQLLRKTCPETHSQQPSLTPPPDVWAMILWMYV